MFHCLPLKSLFLVNIIGTRLYIVPGRSQAVVVNCPKHFLNKSNISIAVRAEIFLKWIKIKSN